MKNSYSKLKEKHQKEVEDFPLVYAFTNKQFEEGMIELGLEPSQTDKVYKLSDTGAFYRKTDAKALGDLFAKQENERNAAIDADKTGEGYVYEMFKYELQNHEYNYTRDVSQTLDTLGYTSEEISSNPILEHGLKKAMRAATV